MFTERCFQSNKKSRDALYSVSPVFFYTMACRCYLCVVSTVSQQKKQPVDLLIDELINSLFVVKVPIILDRTTILLTLKLLNMFSSLLDTLLRFIHVGYFIHDGDEI